MCLNVGYTPSRWPCGYKINEHDDQTIDFTVHTCFRQSHMYICDIIYLLYIYHICYIIYIIYIIHILYNIYIIYNIFIYMYITHTYIYIYNVCWFRMVNNGQCWFKNEFRMVNIISGHFRNRFIG